MFFELRILYVSRDAELKSIEMVAVYSANHSAEAITVSLFILTNKILFNKIDVLQFYTTVLHSILHHSKTKHRYRFDIIALAHSRQGRRPPPTA